MMTFATLRALHVCIGDAINDLARIYEARSPSALDHLDYPSLDVPHYPNAPISPADQLSEELINDPSALVAIRHIVAACGQLCATVSRPGESLIDIAVSVRGLSEPLPRVLEGYILMCSLGPPAIVHALHGGRPHRRNLTRSRSSGHARGWHTPLGRRSSPAERAA